MALKGENNEERIWNYLRDHGLNNCGTAGLMGNLMAESGLNPINLQNSFEKKLGMTDETYTARVDNGTYTNFVHDKAGYGLAQWTWWTRKQNLLAFANSSNRSIGDLEMQLDFLMKELTESYGTILTLLKTTKTIRAASNAVLLHFEKPADQGTKVQQKRFDLGMEIFDRHAVPHSSAGKSLDAVLDMGFLTGSVGGKSINSSIRCHPDNYKTLAVRTPVYIVMHYTGNMKDTARNNAAYFSSAGRNASAHFFVDDSEIYQSVAIKDVAWHCGAKKYYHADCRNNNSIGIEMCCTAGNYTISEKTKRNAADLCAHLCRMLGIREGGVDTFVLRHYDVTHKKCPAQMVANPREWIDFLDKVKQRLRQ